jgi:hypothetical protein
VSSEEIRLIDTPSSLATLETWEAHLQFLQGLPDFRNKARAIKKAKDLIEQKCQEAKDPGRAED